MYGDNSPISLKLEEFGGNGEIEAGEAKQYAESTPIYQNTQEGKQDTKSVSAVTIIDSEPQSGLTEADQNAVTICLEVQNRAGKESSKTDEIMAWMENAEKATNKAKFEVHQIVTSQEVGA
ncbi:hypothetical protein FAGAP_9976 [Fusarium agapanthi]|uniref:Uncharacterized protein n=1 Tax=Fusarium agapanthi TaxID=1803897 RepID=A0A9P5B2U1_9HYPO|nr:hypothetical protein FAGAP_9976 [Fusarium agapanthi]